MSLRVILDTSTLVSAALRIGSIPHQALIQALATCDVCASTETLAELSTVLNRAKFDSYLDRGSRGEFISLIHRHAHLFVLREEDRRAVETVCRDSLDNQFLALALASEAKLLVSSDDDLLVLHPWRGISIVTPREFLVRSDAPRDTRDEPVL